MWQLNESVIVAPRIDNDDIACVIDGISIGCDISSSTFEGWRFRQGYLCECNIDLGR